MKIGPGKKKPGYSPQGEKPESLRVSAFGLYIVLSDNPTDYESDPTTQTTPRISDSVALHQRASDNNANNSGQRLFILLKESDYIVVS